MKKQSIILTCSKNRPNAFLQFACKFITEDNAGIRGKKLGLESDYLFRNHPHFKIPSQTPRFTAVASSIKGVLIINSYIFI